MATATGQGGFPVADTALKRRLNVEVYRLSSEAAAGTIAAPSDFTNLQGVAGVGRTAQINAGFTSIAFSFLRETDNYDGSASDAPNGVRIGCMEYRPGYGPTYATSLPVLNAGEGGCYDFAVNAEAFGNAANASYVEIVVERPIN